MAGLGGDGSHADGGPARHIPVLLDEVIAALQPENGKHIIDGTFGAGGYTRRILEAGASITGIDRDPTAIAAGRAMEQEFPGRLTLVPGRFSQLDMLVPGGPDGIVLDIGVSSMQIDEAERGFSFQKDGPLDMRMSAEGVSAADVVNRLKLGDLARIFNFLGEEKNAGRIARMIDKRRVSEPFIRTRDLANAIEALVGRHPKDRIHPATRVFQALRIFVNDELGELARALFAAERMLEPGGRLVVVTFHSLEDRIVKRFFADRLGGSGGSRHLPQVQERLPSFTPLGKGVVGPSPEEEERNPRARSAKLRAAVRTANPPLAADLSIFGLPKLPDANDINRN
ncbi:16S rRNA (cytosine(1402)-N(4))-methyltransferase RsmH [Phyllobacterium phragmitis]|uniref:Ribosomal RNA small subunit methyltransferase H n=2 Tax=Phyllobacterium phragmitis TaxID=2670329 RepID=A0A2S9IXY2_9HYPH|nr:16S rRNA (cytosine(1402)-N(4))-methyltransferase RsmH [Phyllobacterium phragmitis]